MRIVVFVTASSKKEARLIAGLLVEKKLAACVNIVDNIESVFRWKGKIDRAKEVLLVIKSRKDKFKKIVDSVRSLHSYDVPEIIALPISAGFDKYLRWIDGAIRHTA